MRRLTWQNHNDPKSEASFSTAEQTRKGCMSRRVYQLRNVWMVTFVGLLIFDIHKARQGRLLHMVGWSDHHPKSIEWGRTLLLLLHIMPLDGIEQNGDFASSQTSESAAFQLHHRHPSTVPCVGFRMHATTHSHRAHSLTHSHVNPH